MWFTQIKKALLQSEGLFYCVLTLSNINQVSNYKSYKYASS